MRIITLLIFFQLFLPAAYADDFSFIQPVAAEFGNVWFGAAPPQDLICIWGHCLAEVPGREPMPAHNPLASYVKPVDSTHIERVRIAPPEYFFHADRLFQVIFQLLCADELAEFCMQTAAADLDRRFGLLLLESSSQPGENGKLQLLRRYRTLAGAIVIIARRHSYPYVKIYDPALLEGVRKAANPDYSAKPFR